MHHLAYKLMRHPVRRKHGREKELCQLTRTSPIDSELGTQDREENEILRTENLKLKACLKDREEKIKKLQAEILRIEEQIKSPNGQTSEHEKYFSVERMNSIYGSQNGSIKNANEPALDSLVRHSASEELQIVKDALCSLRRCFPPTDPYQHTIETVEQSLSSLLERVANGEITTNGDGVHPESYSLDSCNDHQGMYASSERSLPRSLLGVFKEASTKVVYYTSKSTTPFLFVIPKNLGDITLKDFKIYMDRPGQFRYHFKTLDRDYGIVKEEVVHDDEIIPGWDDKIVAWIEDDED